MYIVGNDFISTQALTAQCKIDVMQDLLSILKWVIIWGLLTHITLLFTNTYEFSPRSFSIGLLIAIILVLVFKTKEEDNNPYL